MVEAIAIPNLTSALEDYLETIYELVREQKFARVRDIARARGVRSASVSPAMKRLADMKLIRYVRREYIDLTPEGEAAARRVYARHQVLTRFFEEVLQMPSEQARVDACSMEHSLSAEGMSHLVRFFEFIGNCPEGKQFLERYSQCPIVNEPDLSCGEDCRCEHHVADSGAQREPGQPLSAIKPGQQARVTHVNGEGAIRQRLLDMGLLPDVVLEVERVAPAGDPIWIKLQGFQLSLRRNEAEAVVVEAR
jgi:DtxR family Mn-dependent transcriptional regulator